ncbi:MAG: T9SS type B sorting domain-containing protein [Cellulophaga sp.]|uniref:T9SS type B sorting domain-containing protein n=1 Tax=Cellulophaga sp. TaxID=1972202 RepID=UPI003267944E
MKPTTKLLAMALLLPLLSFGQTQASNWYFGEGAGLRFNNDGSVTAVTDGKLNTTEGCATISDDTGNLLFYTDGIRVYTKDHVLMQNGTGLYGDPSSSQSALIVPNQKDTNIFYIFTVDTSVFEADPDYGLNYSTVDMSLDGGKGAVTSKNVRLLDYCSEKITAVLKDCFDKSVWVITYATNDGSEGVFDTFHAFEVNDTGVVTTSVKSKVNSFITDKRGYLKLSADGTKMASANVSQGLYLYDFNADTGVLSNEQRININAPNKDPYGLEFSPNNKLLYVHTYNAQQGLVTETSNLLQYNLTAANISSSEVILDNRNIYRGALQLAENGKIYRTIANSYDQGTQYLGVINNPNQLGTTAGYQHNAVNLQGKLATQGLPPFIQSFFAKEDLVKNTDGSTSPSLTICETDNFTLEVDNFPGATYAWSLNGVPIINNSNILNITNATLADAGKYALEVTPADPSECPIIGEAQVNINTLPIALNTTLTQCDLDSNSTDGFASFNLEQASFDISNGIAENTVNFYASITDRDANIPITNPIGYRNTTATKQTIYTSVTNENNCVVFAELILEVQPTTSSLPTRLPYYACDVDALDTEKTGSFNLDAIKTKDYPGLEVSFYVSIEDASLEFNPISGEDYISTSATLYARLEASNQCQGVEEITLIVQPTPEVVINDEYFLCTDNPVLGLNAEVRFDMYQWLKIEANGTENLISNTANATITAVGNYRLEVGYSYNGGTLNCVNSKEFKVTPSNIAVITNVEVKDLSNNNSISIIVTGDGDYEYAILNPLGPYQDSNTFTNVPTGILEVFVRDKKGCGTTAPFEVSVIGYPKTFTPNGDAINDTWQISGISSTFLAKSDIYIFDRYGVLVAKIDPSSSGWDGDSKGIPVPESDYWFRAKLENGRDFNGHFSLKR